MPPCRTWRSTPSPWPAPWWIDAGLQTLGYLGGLFGVVAIANTPKRQKSAEDTYQAVRGDV